MSSSDYRGVKVSLERGLQSWYSLELIYLTPIEEPLKYLSLALFHLLVLNLFSPTASTPKGVCGCVDLLTELKYTSKSLVYCQYIH